MSWTHFSDTHPKARKEYRCYLCGLPIPIGTEHVARRGVCDNELVTMRMHAECEQVTHSWREDDWECNMDEYGFRQELEEWRMCGTPIPPFEVAVERAEKEEQGA